MVKMTEEELLEIRPDLAGRNLSSIRRLMLEMELSTSHIGNFDNLLDPLDANESQKNHPDLAEEVNQVVREMGWDLSKYKDRAYRGSPEAKEKSYTIYKKVIDKSNLKPERFIFTH